PSAAPALYALSLPAALPISPDPDSPPAPQAGRRLTRPPHAVGAQAALLRPARYRPAPGSRPAPVTCSQARRPIVSTGPVVSAKKDRKSTRLNSSHVKISYAV